LENSITPEAALFPVEAAADFQPAPMGRESATHPRYCHSCSGRGWISLPSLHLPLSRI